MTKPKIKIASKFQNRKRSGMTLIELLVAISILVIISAILVPQLRFASADRNIREAARMAASMFAQASQRAINDGVAGVLIERNPNIVDDNGVAYAGTSMFIMRQIPRYIGEDDTARATNITINDNNNDSIIDSISVTIPSPLEQTALGTIRIGDQISFGDQSQLRFFITDITEVGGALNLTLAPSDLGTPSPVDSTFIIYRQPRRLASSRIDLPTGFLLDLRLSGELATPDTSYFALDARSAGTPADPNTVTYIFNGRGTIDRFFYSEQPDPNDPTSQRRFNLPTQAAYLMVREYSTDEGGESIQSVLNNERSMWVTVELTTGAANVIPGAAVDLAGNPLNPTALRDARFLGSRGQAAQ